MYVRRLIWDSWNVPHIGRHEVTPDEVEEICHRRHAVRAGYANRIMLIGRTTAGRALAVILDPDTGEDAVYYPVTARPADRKERTIYDEFASDPTSNEEEASD